MEQEWYELQMELEFIGGSGSQKDLLELKCSYSFCSWSLLEKQLYEHRWFPVAIVIPDSFVDCEN
jgi:hypothetical protein